MNEIHHPKVDAYIERLTEWKDEALKIRSILLSFGLSEEMKWGKPCYQFGQNNVAIIQVFKSYFALLFFKGALLRDENGLLVKTGDNTQAGRQIRFENIDEILEMEHLLKAYVFEAIELEKSGAKVSFKSTAEYPVCEELQQKMIELPELKVAFEALTPGRQRAYLIYFSQAKQPATRVSRIEKNIPQILSGKGLNE